MSESPYRGLGRLWLGWLLILVLLAFAVYVVGSGRSKLDPKRIAEQTFSGEAQAASIDMAAGARVVAEGLAQPPELTPEQKAEMEQLQANSHRSGPDVSLAELPTGMDPGPGQPASTAQRGAKTSRAAAPLAAGDPFANANVVGGLGPNGFQSFVQEPSSDNSGANIFQSGNWYATRSFDGGTTWQYVSPFSIFGSGFCCDQVVIYDPGRDRWFWLLQYNNRLVLANSGDLINWCFYNWTPANVGANGSFDYNDLALGTNNIYLASNIFGTSTWTTMVRIPIDPQVTCSGFGFSYVTRSDLGFTWKPVSGASDVMYWGTNWYAGAGQVFRVFKWAENSGSYQWWNLAISQYGFYTRNSGQDCGGGGVANWCQFSDSRVLGGARYQYVDGTSRLVFSFNAKQGAPYGLPYPFSERVYVNEATMGYMGSDRLWASWAAFQFMSLATDARGHIGMTTIFGGGGYYPSGSVLIQDDVSPNQPWVRALDVLGSADTCTYGGLYRYGDYMTTRPLRPTNLAWVGTFYIIDGPNACGNTPDSNVPIQVQFGRTRDIPGAVNRWG